MIGRCFAARARVLAWSSVLMLVGVGCGPDRHESPSITESSISADPAADVARATWDVATARAASDRVDADLLQLLGRVAPALDGARTKAFVQAFEARADVEAVRSDFLGKASALAALLDSIHRSPDLAKQVSLDPGVLMTAYETLAATPLSAGAVRFAGVLLALDDGSPYANLKNLGAIDAHAAKLLYDGLPAAFVERAADDGGDPDRGLADLRGFLVGSAAAGALVAALADQATLVDATRLGRSVMVAGAEIGPSVHTLGSIVALWDAGTAARDGDVRKLIESGPDAIAAVLEATNTLRRALGGGELLWAEKAATIASRVGAGITVLVSAYETMEDLSHLDTTDGKIRTVGNCLVLAGSIIALTGGSGALLVAVGTAALLVADLVKGPPPDQLTPLLQSLAASDALSADAAIALGESDSSSLAVLAQLGLNPDQVLWVVARSPGAASSPSPDGLYRPLAAIAASFTLRADSLDAVITKIASDPDATSSRVKLTAFLRFTWDASKFWPAMPHDQIVAQLDSIASTLVIEDFDGDDSGVQPATELALAKSALAAAHASLASVH
jgi:hypothetical protein